MKGQGRPKRLPRPVQKPMRVQNPAQEGVMNNALAFKKGGLVERLRKNAREIRSI